MSLNFRLDAIKDYETVCYRTVNGELELKPSTRDIIFATMAVGIGDLNEKTLDEFYFRQDVWNLLHGFEEFAYEDLKAHIGMRTNVSMESRAKWSKRILDGHARDLLYRQRRQAEQPALAT